MGYMSMEGVSWLLESGLKSDVAQLFFGHNFCTPWHPCVHWPAMSGFVTKFGQKRGAEVAQAPDDAKHYGCWLFFRDHVTHTNHVNIATWVPSKCFFI